LTGKKIAIVASPNGTDGKKVTGIQQGNGITFNNINVAASGEYTVTLLYLAGTASTLEVKANSHKPVQVQFPSTSGNASDSTVVGAKSIVVKLNAGTNTLTLSNPNIGAPDIDSVIVAE